MFSPSRKMIYLALLCALLFIAGMVQLFLLRFEAGNVYPIYSSLRTDPLGTRALFEALHRTSGAPVDRNFRSLDQAELDGDTTIMIVGLEDHRFYWGRKKYEKLLDNLAQSGGRLVIAFTAASGHRIEPSEDGEKESASRNGIDSKEQEPIEEFVEEERSDEDAFACNGEAYWYGLNALGFRFKKPDAEPLDDYAVRFSEGAGLLPPTIEWRAPLSFDLRHNGWETIYRWQDEPVVVRRTWGEGEVVMLADSYLLSNEALRNHRAAGLLAWLVAPGNSIIFDEYLKGLVKQPGMAGLARQYRLHGIFAALLVLVCLFIWHQSAIFIAPVQDEDKPSATLPAAGRDTSQGLVHLARQHIDTTALLTLCFQAWKGQAAQRQPEERIAEVQAMVRKAASDPHKETQVRTYREICELLKQGKRS